MRNFVVRASSLLCDVERAQAGSLHYNTARLSEGKTKPAALESIDEAIALCLDVRAELGLATIF